MRKLNSLKLLLSALLLAIGCHAWGEKTVLFHESFGDNSGSARDWSDTYSVKSGESTVYNGISSYTVTNVKQGKNTTGSIKSGLNQSSKGTDAVLIIGPLNLSKCSNITLTYQWKAASINGTYTTKAYYATSATGTYTEMSGTGNGATSFVTRSYSVPTAAQVSTMYLKIVWNTSNTQAIIDEVDLSGEITKVTRTLDAIALSGQKTSFWVGDAFSFGGTVTASYQESSVEDEDVTSKTIFSGYDMNTIGTQTVTASYTEGEITKTQTYDITVSPLPTYTLTINQPADGGELTVKNGETTLSSGATVEVGTKLTCEVTNIPEGKEFYRFYAKWDNGESRWRGTNPATFDNIAKENITACEISVTYQDLQKVTVNFYGVNNELISSSTKYEGSEFDVPSNPDDVLEYSFAGWAESAVSTETTTKPDFVEFATTTFTASKDKNYYAVYTKKIGSGETYTITKDNVPSAYNTSGESVTINGKVFVMTSVACFSRYSNNIQFAKNTSSITTNEDLAANITSIELTYATTNSNRDLTVNVNGNISPSINGNVYTFDCSSKNSKQFTIANSTSNTDNLDLIVITCGSSTSYYTSTIVTAYTRSVTEGNYGTICLPYGVAADAYSGATIYNVGGVTKQGDAITGIVLVEEEGALEAGKPYIFQASANEIVLTYSGEPAGVQPANGLIGNLGKEITIEASESAFYYVLSGKTLYHLAGTSNATIGKNKAYLNLEGIDVYQVAQTQSRVAVIPVNGQPTALENSALNAEVKKVVINGQMMILRDGNMFDLNGRLVK